MYIFTGPVDILQRNMEFCDVSMSLNLQVPYQTLTIKCTSNANRCTQQL